MSFEEIPLMKILGQFDISLAQKYVAVAQTLLNELPKFRHDIEKISSEGTKLGFRFTAITPTYLVLSRQLCRFDSKRLYPFAVGFEKYMVKNMGLIPVYLASYNRMTILKVWDKVTDLYFDKENSPLDENKPICWRLDNSVKSPKISSMNFILTFGSPTSYATKRMPCLMLKYFSKFFWEYSNFKISSSSHLLHFKDRITGMINVAKSIFIIEKVLRKKTIKIQGKPVPCYELVILGIMADGNHYDFKNIRVFMESSMVEQFKLNDNDQRGFFNGLITEIKQINREKKYETMKLFQVVDKYDTNYFELISALIGLVCTNTFRKSDALSVVGTVDEIKQEVGCIIDIITRKIHLDMTIGSGLDNWFEKAMEELSPILLIKNKHIHYIHPLVWSIFEKMKFPDISDQYDSILLDFIAVLENVLEMKQHKLRQMTALDSLKSKGINVDILMKETRKLANNILLAKKIDRAYMP